MRYRMLLAYNGAPFRGWQTQQDDISSPTIQGAVETALFDILGDRVRVHGSGRTDAGVSAEGQIAHFDADAPPTMDFRRALNSRLPSSIRVLDVARASPDFHARKSAIYKIYTYRFWRDPFFVPPVARDSMWAVGDLDADRIRASARGFVGLRDFASFQNAGTPQETTTRRVFSIIARELSPDPTLPPHIPPLALSVCANGFLKQMVRNIAGYLAETARGRTDGIPLDNILAERDRTALKTPTAPARGLALTYVAYSPRDSFFIAQG